MLILLLILLSGLLFLLAAFFDKHCQDHFTISLKLDQPRAAVNESFDLLLSMQNEKWLILPVVRLHLSLPDTICSENPDKGRSLVLVTSLFSYEKIHSRIALTGTKRGIYEIKAEAELTDFLGFFKQTITLPALSIIIHPPIYDLASVQGQSGNEGDRLVQRWLYPDPIFFTGSRPYFYQDAMKEIDWKASAKANELRVKQHDTTASLNVVLCILAQNNENLYAENAEYLETAIEAAAALIHEAARNQSPTGLITNCVMKYDFGPTLRPDYGTNHLLRLYDTLAALAPYQRISSTRTLQSINDFLTVGSECFLYCNQISDEIANALYAFSAKGIHTTIFLYEEYADLKLPSSIRVIPLTRRNEYVSS